MTTRLVAHHWCNLFHSTAKCYRFHNQNSQNYSTLVDTLKSSARLTPTSTPSSFVETARHVEKTVKRPTYKQRCKLRDEMTPNIWAYATAEEYDFPALKHYFSSLENKRYEIRPVGGVELRDIVLRLVDREAAEDPDKSNIKSLITDAAIKRAPHGNEVLLFREGVAVTWNLGHLERAKLLSLLARFQIGRVDNCLMQTEAEKLTYILNEQLQVTQFKEHEVLHMRPSTYDNALEDEASFLEKYAISDAMARSVKLSLKEHALCSFVETLDPIVDDLKNGNIRVNKRSLLKKTGQLFALRHDINLESDLLDGLPDFYWDREQLERLYTQASRLLCIEKRTRVMNEKLNYCLQLGERLDSHLNATHSVRLERIIIFLIALEVAFECVPYLVAFVQPNNHQPPPPSH